LITILIAIEIDLSAVLSFADRLDRSISADTPDLS